MKNNVEHYGLKPINTEYSRLDDFYDRIDLLAVGAWKINKFFIPHNLIRDNVTRRIHSVSLTDITGDERLLKLLPQKTHQHFVLSNFYKGFTNF